MPFQVRGERNKEKPLIRKKSDLPSDTGTVRALLDHIRPDDYLKTPPDINKCQNGWQLDRQNKKREEETQEEMMMMNSLTLHLL